MNLVGTHHVALYSANFAAMREFYTGTLGLFVVGGFAGRNIVFLHAGSTTIELVEHDGGARGTLGWAHLAFEVADFDAEYAELAARGIGFHVPPKDFPETAPAARIAFFKDPDGNELELFQPLGSRVPQPV